ncbi:hypothetical protein AFB00_30975 (plasmid) [Pseudonocardia sp. HH130630-07]|nr:hypothetical protein AFB00_30975 [Pseudonocardia sp. HH130630-07]
MNPAELHSMAHDPESRATVEVGQDRAGTAEDQHHDLTSGRSPEPSRQGAAALVSMRRAVSRVWWWVLLPLARSIVASAVWAGFGERMARALSRGLVQAAAVCCLLLGLVLSCGPAAVATMVGALAAAASALLLWRQALPGVVSVAGLVLGVGLLILPDVMVVVSGAVLTAVGVAVLAIPPGRAAYAHTERARVRTGFGGEGWAGWWDLHRHLSAHAVRLAAAATRPSVTAEVSWPAPGGVLAPGLVERLPVRRCGTWLGRSVVGPVIGTDCYAPHRDVIGLVAPPQTGKTALMGHHILDHDGPLLATSTKPDLYNYCAGKRAQQGPVWLFNPEQLGDQRSSVWWSPVSGCADAQVAAVRAGLMVGGVSTSEDGGDRWDQWSVSVLTALLMAADLSGTDMARVARWVFSPTSDARSGGAGEALQILGRNPGGRVPEGTLDALRQVLATDARKTRDSIFMTLSEAVKFMTDPQVAALVTGSDGGQELDAEQLLAGRGSLFVVGSDRKHASIAPLLAAMTGHLFETAKRVASSRPKGRLDPPLGLFLDEAALITPVPLDRWVADAGGRGIHIEWAVQSPSQLAQRWGAKGGETIWNATNAKVIFGGLSLREDLEKASVLCGDRHEPVPTGDGEERYEKVRVCPVDRVRTIPQWHALLIHRATPATMVRVSPVWERSDLRPPPAIITQAPTSAAVRAAGHAADQVAA